MAPEDVLVVVNGVGGLDDDDLANRVRMLRLESNRGPAGGMKAGLGAAVETTDAQWIYLCEDDIGASGLPGDRLDRVRALIGDHESAGGGPVGAVAAYSRTLSDRTGLTAPHLPTETETGLISTDVASWGATLISRRVVEAGIVPDDSLFFGYEDFDFFLSMQAAGFEMLLDADCARELGRSVHPSGREETLGDERAIDDTEPWRRYYEARNFLHLRRRHGHLGWTATHLAKSLRRASLGSAAHRTAVARGLIDGFRGRTGPNPDYLRRADGEADERTIDPSLGGPT